MSQISLRGSLEWALMVTLIFAGGAIAKAQSAQAQNDSDDQDAATAPSEQQPPGKIVRIGPAGDAQITLDESAADDAARLEAPKHWIGILGGPLGDELRAQIDIPADQGVLVRQVVAGSPADKAGLKAFDILLKANDTQLADVRDLTNLVKSQGESGGQITLDVLRRGKHETVTLTPESRPERPPGGEPGMLGQDMMGPGARGWGFGPPAQPFGFRAFRPGMGMAQSGSNLSQMPSGVSVSIQKQNDEPAHIKVQRGNDTWDIVGDDPSTLAQLPEDVRPFVEGLLAGGGAMQMPGMPNMPGMQQSPMGFDNGSMHEQLERMEQHLQELQQRFEEQFDQPQATNPNESDSEATH